MDARQLRLLVSTRCILEFTSRHTQTDWCDLGTLGTLIPTKHWNANYIPLFPLRRNTMLHCFIMSQRLPTESEKEMCFTSIRYLNFYFDVLCKLISKKIVLPSLLLKRKLQSYPGLERFFSYELVYSVI